MFEHVRHCSRTDSQVFEDSVELQSFFMKRRDELCRGGDVLLSPALQYTEADLQASVETLRAQKLPREQQEADLEIKQEKEKVEGGFMLYILQNNPNNLNPLNFLMVNTSCWTTFQRTYSM